MLEEQAKWHSIENRTEVQSVSQNPAKTCFHQRSMVIARKHLTALNTCPYMIILQYFVKAGSLFAVLRHCLWEGSFP